VTFCQETENWSHTVLLSKSSFHPDESKFSAEKVIGVAWPPRRKDNEINPVLELTEMIFPSIADFGFKTFQGTPLEQAVMNDGLEYTVQNFWGWNWLFEMAAVTLAAKSVNDSEAAARKPIPEYNITRDAKKYLLNNNFIPRLFQSQQTETFGHIPLAIAFVTVFME
jgi:hypothetical protein